MRVHRWHRWILRVSLHELSEVWNWSVRITLMMPRGLTWVWGKRLMLLSYLNRMIVTLMISRLLLYYLELLNRLSLRLQLRVLRFRLLMLLVYLGLLLMLLLLNDKVNMGLVQLLLSDKLRHLLNLRHQLASWKIEVLRLLNSISLWQYLARVEWCWWKLGILLNRYSLGIPAWWWNSSYNLLPLKRRRFKYLWILELTKRCATYQRSS
jgi:hypothetical protein